MRTKQQLSTAVLQGIQVLAAGEDATAEDARLVEDTYDDKLAEWRRIGLVWWPNTGRFTAEIPNEAFSALVDLISNEVIGSFGLSGAPSNAVEKMEIEKSLLRGLRALIHKPPSGEQTPISPF